MNAVQRFEKNKKKYQKTKIVPKKINGKEKKITRFHLFFLTGTIASMSPAS